MWHLLLGDDLQQAHEAEEFCLNDLLEEDAQLPSDAVVWSCLHCRDRPCEQLPMGIHDVKAHIENEHGVLAAEIDVDYTKDFAAPQIYQTETLAQHATVVVELKRPE